MKSIANNSFTLYPHSSFLSSKNSKKRFLERYSPSEMVKRPIFKKTFKFLRDNSIPIKGFRIRDSKEEFNISSIFDPFQMEKSWKNMRLSSQKIRDLHSKANLCITPQNKCIRALRTPIHRPSFKETFSQKCDQFQKTQVLKFNFDQEIPTKSPKKIKLKKFKVNLKCKVATISRKENSIKSRRYRCPQIFKKKLSIKRNSSQSSKHNNHSLMDSSIGSLRIDSQCQIKKCSIPNKTLYKESKLAIKNRTLNMDLRDICMNNRNGY
ncbi:unnamed protein product [Moneuplotes crassus]|uniref:Uncharacterized protein n=1 Tax=Euplotes crassus TaxID=5936 RepID=A0AAD1UPD0_EUPCR|nr:unnamed protein product [Moneuplotes crassus]